MLRVRDEIKIRACNVHHLKRQIHGRKDCTIFIPYSCSKEIERMDFTDYLELQEDLKARNIKLKVEEYQMNIDKEKLKEKLMKYFDIDTNGCMAYNLTRVKEARQYGTLTIDDFVEFVI